MVFGNYQFQNKARKTYLWMRSFMKKPSQDKPVNIYHATVQKTGSQWFKSLFNDPIVVQESGLALYPQHRYEVNEFHQIFPKFTFIPGLYLFYGIYDEIQKPQNYRTIYVLRDPRDIVVSWYHSMLETHVLMGRVEKYRNHLQTLNYEDGLSFCIEVLQMRFAQQRSWGLYGYNDQNVVMVKFEDLIENPFEEFTRIFKHCSIVLSDIVIHELIEKYSFANMKRQDLEKYGSDGKSHYRSGQRNTWKEAFSENHLKQFYASTGNLVDFLGYSRT